MKSITMVRRRIFMWPEGLFYDAERELVAVAEFLVVWCLQAMGYHASLITSDQRGLEDLEHKAAIKK